MIYVFLADGFEEMEAIAPTDILRRAGFDLKTVGVKGKEVTGTQGIKIKSDIDISEIEKEGIEAIILPGGMPGTTNLYNSVELREILKYCFERKILVAAICAAPSILGKMGFLKNKKVCCYPGFESQLEGAILTEDLVCCDGNIVTAKGPGAAMQFGFEILRILKGESCAKEIKSEMQYLGDEV